MAALRSTPRRVAGPVLPVSSRLIAVLAVVCATALTASAAQAAPRPDLTPPLQLPGTATAAASSTWLVGDRKSVV